MEDSRSTQSYVIFAKDSRDTKMTKIKNEDLVNYLKSTRASYADLCDFFQAHRDTVLLHLNEVKKEHEVQSYWDGQEKVFYIESEEDPIPEVQTTSAKRNATHKSRQRYNEVVRAINKIEKETEFPEVTIKKPENEIAVLYLSDIHMGAIQEHNGEVVYNSKIAKGKIKQIYTNASKILDMVERYHEIDEIHIAFLGDIIENDIIYENQKYEIDKRPLEQVSDAVSSFVPFIKKYAKDYNRVHIHTVRGNHGRLSNEAHEDDNWDNIFYHMLKLSLKNVDNVQFNIGENGWNSFYLFNKKIGLTHGENMHHQASTSAGEDKFLKQIVKRDLDELHLGHFHERKSEEVLGKMVYWNGAAKPTGQFEDKIGVESIPTQTMMTYSEDRGTTGIFYIDLREDEEDKDKKL